MSSPTLPKTTTITLITGANKGLGYETAHRLLEAGHTVLLGARDAERGQRAADELGAEFIPIDVTDEASIVAAAGHVRALWSPGRPGQQRGHRRSPPPTARHHRFRGPHDPRHQPARRRA